VLPLERFDSLDQWAFAVHGQIPFSKGPLIFVMSKNRLTKSKKRAVLPNGLSQSREKSSWPPAGRWRVSLKSRCEPWRGADKKNKHARSIFSEGVLRALFFTSQQRYLDPRELKHRILTFFCIFLLCADVALFLLHFFRARLVRSDHVTPRDRSTEGWLSSSRLLRPRLFALKRE